MITTANHAKPVTAKEELDNFELRLQHLNMTGA